MHSRRTDLEQLSLPAADPGVIDLSHKFLEPATNVLDAGCGFGRNAIYLARHGHDVVAIDKDPDMIEGANILAASIGNRALQLNFIEADMLDLPFMGPNFEAVFATRSLQELVNRRRVYRALASLWQVTKENGYNFITAYIGTKHQQAAKPHLAILDQDEIQQVYINAGWAIVDSYTEIKPLYKLENGATLIRSYQQVVAQKPPQKGNQQFGLDFTNTINSEYLKRVGPELYDI